MPRILRPSIVKRRAVGRGLLAAALLAGAVLATVPLAGVASATPGWSAPADVDNTSPGQLSAVSCPTTTFCLAIGGGGAFMTYNGSHWSARGTVLANDPLASVSCVSSTFCAAVDYDGQGFIYNGHDWSVPAELDPGAAMPSVSCATTTFCIAVSGDLGPVGFIYNGSSWSSGVTMDSAATNGIDSVSCPTASFCMAFDDNGNVVMTTDGGTVWSPYSNVDSSSPQSLSCATTTFCAMVDNGGNAFVYNGSSFTPFTGVDAGNAFASVSCATSSTCVAVDQEGQAFRYSSGNWSSGDLFDPFGSPAGVSCPASTTLCMAVDGNGAAITSTDGGVSWGSATVIDEFGSNLSSVSCVSSVFCAAVDSNGNVLTYNGTAWSTPTHIDANMVDAVSCASASFCVAVDDNGEETTYNGTSWSPLVVVDAEDLGLTAVSCIATPSLFCVTVDSDGNAFTSTDGASWAESDIDGETFLTSVSCATASFCAAVDTEGDALTWNGVGWTSAGNIDHSNNFVSVSCTTTPTAFCLAVDNSGNAVAYNGSSWSAYNFDSNVPVAVSCATATSCTALDNGGDIGGGALLWNGAGNSGSDWSYTNIDPDNDLNAISCPSASFCVAVDDNGDALIDNGAAPVVTVSQVSPDTGPTTGSTGVTISGSGFSPGSTVDFAGVAATDVDVMNSTTITASSPAEAAGTVDVIVTTSAGSSTANPADQFTYTVVQSPSNTGCEPSCSATVSTPLNQTQTTVTGSSSSPGANVNLVVNTDTLTCSGTYDYATPVTTLSSTGFGTGATVKATVTVGQEPSKKGVKVCYAASSEATSGTFLRNCARHSPHAPCVQSLADHDDMVTAILLVPATDPRFWAGTGALDLTSFTPTQGPPGRKVTIKGKDLTQVTSVVIGGAQARILTRSAAKVVVNVPQGAVSGSISVTANSGVVVSALPFTVT